MFFNRKKPRKSEWKKTRICCPIFPPRSTTTTTEKKTRWKIENERKKIQIIHYLKFERIFVRPEKKRKTKTTAICLHNWKRKYYEEAKCGGWGGRGTGFCWLPHTHPSPNLAGHTHSHCLTSLSVSSCVGRARSENKVKRNTNKHE